MKNSGGLILISLNLLFLIFLFSPISLTGYWTDILATGVVGLFTIASVAEQSGVQRIILILFSVLHIIHFLRIFMLGILIFFGMSVQKVPIENKHENFIDHQYFIPTGAGGCGNGTTWKTKSFKYFPIIEYEYFRDNCTRDDF